MSPLTPLTPAALARAVEILAGVEPLAAYFRAHPEVEAAPVDVVAIADKVREALALMGGASSWSQMRGADGSIHVGESAGRTLKLPGPSGVYVVPPGVTEIFALVVGGGGGATLTEDGGRGELACHRLKVRPGERFVYAIGKGGAPGCAGGDSSFVAQR